MKASSICAFFSWSGAASLAACSLQGLSSVSFNNKFNASSRFACCPSISLTILYSRTSSRIAKPKQTSHFIVESELQLPTKENLANTRNLDEEVLVKRVQQIVMRILQIYPDKVAYETNILRNSSALYRVGGSGIQIRKLFRSQVAFFYSDYSDNIFSAYAFLINIGMPVSHIFRIFLRYPNLLIKDLPEVKAVLNYLSTEVGVRNVNKLIRSHTYLFKFPLSTLRSRANNLREIGLNPLGRIIERVPVLFKYTEEDMIHKANYFKNLLGEDIYIPVMCRAPTFLTMRIKAADDTYANLVNLFGKEKTNRIIEKQPAVLHNSWPLLNEKIIYFRETMDRHLEDMFLNPTVLTYSLERRIKPRFRALRSLGVDRMFCLSIMFCPTDASFIDRFGVFPILDNDFEPTDKKE